MANDIRIVNNIVDSLADNIDENELGDLINEATLNTTCDLEQWRNLPNLITLDNPLFAKHFQKDNDIHSSRFDQLSLDYFGV